MKHIILFGGRCDMTCENQKESWDYTLDQRKKGRTKTRFIR
jgi:hypothetical protein